MDLKIVFNNQNTSLPILCVTLNLEIFSEDARLDVKSIYNRLSFFFMHLNYVFSMQSAVHELFSQIYCFIYLFQHYFLKQNQLFVQSMLLSSLWWSSQDFFDQGKMNHHSSFSFIIIV